MTLILLYFSAMSSSWMFLRIFLSIQMCFMASAGDICQSVALVLKFSKVYSMRLRSHFSSGSLRIIYIIPVFSFPAFIFNLNLRICFDRFCGGSIENRPFSGDRFIFLRSVCMQSTMSRNKLLECRPVSGKCSFVSSLSGLIWRFFGESLLCWRGYFLFLINLSTKLLTALKLKSSFFIIFYYQNESSWQVNPSYEMQRRKSVGRSVMMPAQPMEIALSKSSSSLRIQQNVGNKQSTQTVETPTQKHAETYQTSYTAPQIQFRNHLCHLRSNQGNVQHTLSQTHKGEQPKEAQKKYLQYLECGVEVNYVGIHFPHSCIELARNTPNREMLPLVFSDQCVELLNRFFTRGFQLDVHQLIRELFKQLIESRDFVFCRCHCPCTKALKFSLEMRQSIQFQRGNLSVHTTSPQKRAVVMHNQVMVFCELQIELKHVCFQVGFPKKLKCVLRSLKAAPTMTNAKNFG